MAISSPNVESAPRFTVRILGAAVVQWGGITLDIERWPAKAGELLRLLAVVRNHRIARDEAIELLWPNTPPAAGVSSLKTSVYRLRRHLEHAGVPCPLVLERAWVLLNREYQWEIDADTLLQATEEAGADVVRLEQVAQLWRGEPLLEDKYEDWAIPVRERLQRTWRGSCLRLVRLLTAGGNPQRAAVWAEQLMEEDPLDEETLRELLSALLQAGRRLDARRALELFTARAREELGVAPEEETLALLHVPTNVPHAATPFIGRQSELQAIEEMLFREDVRLLTLIGVGGVGKTRLALEVATHIRDRYADGVYLISLAPLSDATLVGPAIAATLGIRVHGNQTVEEAILMALRNKQLLVVLDNCEHVLEGIPIAAKILASCFEIQFLATSRERLRLSAEYRYDVGPLVLPTGSTSVQNATSYDAVRLFSTRATVAAPRFALTAENVSDVVQICRVLEGLPLALELAAAQADHLSVPAILAHLTSVVQPRLSMLTDGFRDAPPRQQTLRATVDWSYNLLTPVEQRVFRHLSVFAGGCSLKAAEAVCFIEANVAASLEENLTSLVDKSLLQREDAEKTRFVMLETIREYAAILLEARDERAQLAERHAMYFLTSTEQPNSRDIPSEAWLDRLETDLDNIRASLTWFRTRSQIDAFLRLATALFLFWERRNHLQEGIAWLDMGLASDGRVPGSLQARALRVQGVLMTRLGSDFDGARTLLGQSLSLYQLEGTDQEAIAGAMQNLGLAYKDAGDFRQARPLLEESLARYRALHDTHGTAKLLNNVGRLEWEVGNRERAGSLLSEGLTLSRAAGDNWMHGLNALALARVFTEQGDHVAAGPLLQEGLVSLRATGDKWALALAFRVLAVARLRQNEMLHAVRLFAASAVLLREIAMNEPTESEPEIADARSRLGASAFDDAWREGTCLKVDAAAELALEGLRSAPGSRA